MVSAAGLHAVVDLEAGVGDATSGLRGREDGYLCDLEQGGRASQSTSHVVEEADADRDDVRDGQRAARRPSLRRRPGLVPRRGDGRQQGPVLETAQELVLTRAGFFLSWHGPATRARRAASGRTPGFPRSASLATRARRARTARRSGTVGPAPTPAPRSPRSSAPRAGCRGRRGARAAARNRVESRLMVVDTVAAAARWRRLEATPKPPPYGC